GVASITKSFTALALCILHDEGRLSLDDPVTRYLPFTLWREGHAPTLRHFLEQTSGLPPTPTMTWLRAESQADDPVAAGPTLREALTTVADAEELRRRAEEVSTFEGLVRYLNENVELVGAPGELFSYSNDGFCLMGGVVELVSGRPFDDFVAERILNPLGMDRSTFDLKRVLDDQNHSMLYEHDEDGAVRRSPAWQTTGRMLGGGMLKSTLADLRAYVRFHLAAGGGDETTAAKVGVHPATVRKMGAGRAWAGPGTRYGLGLQRNDDYRGHAIVSHGGGLKGVSSRIGWAPELGVGAVVLCNLGGVPSERIWTMALNAYLGLPLEAASYEPKPYDASEAEVRDVLGSFASGEPYGRLRLFRDESGGLRAATGEPAAEVPAFMAGVDEVALQYPEYAAPVTLLRRNGRVWAAHQGLRVLRKVS
ncbi:MAG TPA: serine hydrolase domain-containing protein, partial [Trueperaceae bacterium]